MIVSGHLLLFPGSDGTEAEHRDATTWRQGDSDSGALTVGCRVVPVTASTSSALT